MLRPFLFLNSFLFDSYDCNERNNIVNASYRDVSYVYEDKNGRAGGQKGQPDNQAGGGQAAGSNPYSNPGDNTPVPTNIKNNVTKLSY